jgi:hypothetical protein
MAPLVQFPIDLSRTATALEGIHAQLSRVADTLERLAPAPPIADPPRPATLSDLRRTDPTSLSQIRSELQTFAENNGVIIDSEAFLQSIMKYEQDVAETYGPEAISELPWNKAAGGPLFQKQSLSERYADNQRRKAEQAGGETRANAEPASGTASEAVK